LAYPRFSPATPVAQQIRSTALGVNGGGSRGRMSQVHKGVGLNNASGGLNQHGSGRKNPSLMPPRMPVPKPRPPRPPRPVKRPAGGSGSNNTVTIQPVLPGPQKPVSASPATVGSVRPDPNKPIDWRGLSSYKRRMSDIDFEARDQRIAAQRQLDDNRRLYADADAVARRDFQRGMESVEGSMNRRGLLRSGARERVEADAYDDFVRFMGDLDNQFGSVAVGRVNEELTRLDGWVTQQRLAAEAEARGDYSALYPAAPVAGVKPKPNTPPSRPKPKPTKPKPTKPKPKPTKPKPKPDPKPALSSRPNVRDPNRPRPQIPARPARPVKRSI
jgi:hypothetical protein